MWNEWVALWGNKRKRTRRGRGAEAKQERVVLDRGDRHKARPGILLCAPLRLKGQRGKVQSQSGQWYYVHADMFRRDNIPEGAGQGDQCWRCTKEARQVPWPVLRMTAWASRTATMHTTDARGQWWGPVLRLPKEVLEDEEAQEGVEVWWGEEQEGKRAGVQIGLDIVQGLQEQGEGVAVSFRMTDTGRPEEEAPHKEGPYQNRPPLCPFRLLPLLIYSGSTIAFLKFKGPKSKNIENTILLQP